jgi:hypothetical protein
VLYVKVSAPTLYVSLNSVSDKLQLPINGVLLQPVQRPQGGVQPQVVLFQPVHPRGGLHEQTRGDGIDYGLGRLRGPVHAILQLALVAEDRGGLDPAHVRRYPGLRDLAGVFDPLQLTEGFVLISGVVISLVCVEDHQRVSSF